LSVCQRERFMAGRGYGRSLTTLGETSSAQRVMSGASSGCHAASCADATGTKTMDTKNTSSAAAATSLGSLRGMCTSSKGAWKLVARTNRTVEPLSDHKIAMGGSQVKKRDLPPFPCMTNGQLRSRAIHTEMVQTGIRKRLFKARFVLPIEFFVLSIKFELMLSTRIAKHMYRTKEKMMKPV